MNFKFRRFPGLSPFETIESGITTEDELTGITVTLSYKRSGTLFFKI